MYLLGYDFDGLLEMMLHGIGKRLIQKGFRQQTAQLHAEWWFSALRLQQTRSQLVVGDSKIVRSKTSLRNTARTWMRATSAVAVRQNGTKKPCASCPDSAAAARRTAGTSSTTARQLPRRRCSAARTAPRVGSHRNELLDSVAAPGPRFAVAEREPNDGGCVSRWMRRTSAGSCISRRSDSHRLTCHAHAESYLPL